MNIFYKKMKMLKPGTNKVIQRGIGILRKSQVISNTEDNLNDTTVTATLDYVTLFLSVGRGSFQGGTNLVSSKELRDIPAENSWSDWEDTRLEIGNGTGGVWSDWSWVHCTQQWGGGHIISL